MYSLCFMSAKKVMWGDLLMSEIGFGGDFWYVVGDFNAVKNRSEKRGLGNSFQNSEFSDFQGFINDLNLIDLPLLGNRFTWSKPDGSAMSRLDRFLLFDDWISLWGVVAQWVEKQDVSYHCPIMLKGGILN